ncbi:MAG: ATP-dependent DNA helicase, partial [Hyphomicrobiales bacterium]
EKAEELDSSDRSRLEGAAGGIERRVLGALGAWVDMLAALEGETPPEFADWFALDRHQGRDVDIGLHRHWIDPARPFAEVVLAGVDGAVMTSATLRDRPPEVPEDWASAQMRTGAQHLVLPPRHFAAVSPFDYGAQTRIFVITDVTKTDPDLVASAMRALMMAAGGGALGLFTAIHRLKAVHERLAGPLLQAGIPLYAQHIDPLDTGSLVDIFRAEARACLLGTDALRDGVDVPGDSLRLAVFDRVPWPRSNIIERKRRAAFGGNAWTDMTTRLKLAQAFGRLIRKRDDKGVFVLLDRQTPTRLLSAFPPEAPVERVGLAEAVRQIGDFLSH